MNIHPLLIALLLSAQTAGAQHQVKLLLNNGTTETYATTAVDHIDIDGSQVTVAPTAGAAVTHRGDVSIISFQKQGSIRRAQGWQESAFVEWERSDDAAYNVYIRPAGTTTWTQLDAPLVRLYKDYGRADAVGLRPGSYQMRVVPVTGGQELAAQAAETGMLVVKAYDRAGFAHKNHPGVGAYQDNGTLKPGAQVVYVTAATAKTVTAKLNTGSFTGLQAILNAYQKGNVTTPLAVRIVGLLRTEDLDALGSSAEGLQVKGHKADSPLHITIEGIGDDATFKGFGLLIRNSQSVEVRNLGIMRQMDDGISLDTDNSNIWVHNIDVFYGRAGSGDHAKGDGAIDVKTNSKWVTVSYCHFWDTGKSTMCGMKSESGPNYISYHHNWFDHSDSRHARVRTMSVHLWNNYFDGVSKYGIGATSGSSIFAEANYFRATRNPLLSSLQGTDIAGNSKGTFSGEPGGIIKAYGNIYAEQGKSHYAPVAWTSTTSGFDCYNAADRQERVPTTVVTIAGKTGYDNFDTDASLMYAYTPDVANDVPARVTGYYGAGRLDHGDLQFTFNNAVDDTHSDVNTALAALIDSYGGNTATPAGQGSETPEEPTQPVTPGIAAAELCSFDKAGHPSSSRFTVTGNGSNSKGTATFEGNTYDTCLKMESATNVSFTTTQPMNLTLVFGDTETASFKLDGEKYASSASTHTITALPAGQHTITKRDSRNLFLLVLTPVGGEN